MIKIFKKFLSRMVASAGIVVFGALPNLAVISVNHWRMPVYEPGCPYGLVIDNMHECAGLESHLMPLADLILYRNWIYSVGDLLIFTGQALALITTFIMVVSCIAHYAFGRGSKKSGI
jgi:hypothetical protein